MVHVLECGSVIEDERAGPVCARQTEKRARTSVGLKRSWRRTRSVNVHERHGASGRRMRRMRRRRRMRRMRRRRGKPQ